MPVCAPLNASDITAIASALIVRIPEQRDRLIRAIVTDVSGGT